ncbi:MAG: DUF835 domain-containing protein [Halobacteriota archaeon]|nr:DUF835 domain-containing protein [Halobacteriota archaeon]
MSNEVVIRQRSIESMIDKDEGNAEVKRTLFIVEDDEGLGRLIAKHLKRAGFQCDLATNGTEAIAKIGNNQNILLLLDYGLPDMTGKEIVEKLIEKKVQVPFVVMTGQGDERVAVDMMKLGARDYIVKDARFMDLLPMVVRRAIKQLGTEGRLAETKIRLRESQRTITTLMGNLPGMAYRCENDEERTMIFVSEGCIKLSGYEPLDLKESSYAELIHPDDLEMVLSEIDSAVEEKRPFEITYRINSTDDEERWVLEKGLGVFSPDGGLNALEGFIMDITDRKMAEEELLVYKERLEKLVEESPIATISTDLSGTIITMNKSAKKLLEVEKYENKHLSSILGVEMVMMTKNDFSLKFKKAKGPRIPLNVSTVVLREGKEKKGLIITLEDISKLSGLDIKPVEEDERVETDMEFEIDNGNAYLIDSDSSDIGFEVFVDLVKHGKPGLCISRQNPIRIKERYKLEKTPVIWLTRNEVTEVTCIHPTDLITKLQSTLVNFIKEANDGVVLMDGLEYLISQNDFSSVLKFVQAINDDLMMSKSRLIIPLDSNALDPQRFHGLKKEMVLFKGK